MQGGQPRAVKKPSCVKCGVVLGPTGRTIIGGRWHCAKCTYELDYPDKEIQPTKRKRAAAIQEETLFPLPRPIDRD